MVVNSVMRVIEFIYMYEFERTNVLIRAKFRVFIDHDDNEETNISDMIGDDIDSD